MLFGGVIDSYSGNNLHKNFGIKSAESLIFKLGGTDNSHCALKGLRIMDLLLVGFSVGHY